MRVAKSSKKYTSSGEDETSRLIKQKRRNLEDIQKQNLRSRDMLVNRI